MKHTKWIKKTGVFYKIWRFIDFERTYAITEAIESHKGSFDSVINSCTMVSIFKHKSANRKILRIYMEAMRELYDPSDPELQTAEDLYRTKTNDELEELMNAHYQ